MNSTTAGDPQKHTKILMPESQNLTNTSKLYVKIKTVSFIYSPIIWQVKLTKVSKYFLFVHYHFCLTHTDKTYK